MTGHAHGWELAAWWLCIAAPIVATGWRLRPSRQRALAELRARAERDLRRMAEDSMFANDYEDQGEYQ